MIKALFKKEFIDTIRDKRSVVAALFGALFTPLLFAVMMTFNIEKARSVDDVYIEINNGDMAPQIVELLERDSIYHAELPSTGKKFELDGETHTHSKISLTFSDDFESQLSSGLPANILINADYSDQERSSQIRRVKRVLENYEGAVLNMRLVARGISPLVIDVVDLEEQDTSTPGSKSAIILGMLGVFILFSVFVSSTNVAIDCSAGERERNSLELLLMQPVSTFDVVASKTINTGLFGLFAGTLSIALTAVVIPFIPLHKIGMAFNFDLEVAVKMWFIILPLAFFAAAFQLVTTFHAKSFKEAQTYIQYSIMLPLIVPMALEFSKYKHAALDYLPIVAQQQAISKLIRGELTDFTPVIGGMIVTMLFSYGLVLFTSKSLKSEKVVLGL